MGQVGFLVVCLGRRQILEVLPLLLVEMQSQLQQIFLVDLLMDAQVLPEASWTPLPVPLEVWLTQHLTLQVECWVLHPMLEAV